MPRSLSLGDQVGERARARVTHDRDAVRIGGERLAEVVEHLLGQPGGILLDQIGDAERLGRGARAVGARQGGAVARIAAHLHVDGHALAEGLLRRRRSCRSYRQHRQRRHQRHATPGLRHARLPVIGRSRGAFRRSYSPGRRRKARSPPAAVACTRADGRKGWDRSLPMMATPPAVHCQCCARPPRHPGNRQALSLPSERVRIGFRRVACGEYRFGIAGAIVMRRLITLAIVVVATALGGPARAAEILIGVAGPMTGTNAWFGGQMERGAALGRSRPQRRGRRARRSRSS